MLVMNSPFRDIDSLFDQFTGRSSSPATTAMPMDAYRRDSDIWVHLDLPGVAADSLDVSVERNVLTVTGERSWQRREGDQTYLAERRSGTFRRQVTLGDGLDADAIEADYTDGVLSLRIPVAEKAQPRKISIGTGSPSTAPAIETTADAS
ncbi:Hsp20/alpha crystallin family protein [Ilumatobacter nonamiensis]|uniref:Hsp20/alpha crystallin family protein n=1 Tax=Ilumatobacter nonamiensis TaxID=467093 RepID=UPI00034B4960|nr:Hsp20/alpha crystallin family protein [Ilumatobacter nonamiensis]